MNFLCRVFFFKQKTAYEMRISDWSSDVCSSDLIDLHYLGALNSEWCERGMRKMIAFRDAGNEHRYFDIHFAPFQNDPLPIIAQLYDFLGEPLTQEARDRMLAWRRDTPRDQHGEHRYEVTEFGIESARIQARFRFYAERFDVAA